MPIKYDGYRSWPLGWVSRVTPSSPRELVDSGDGANPEEGARSPVRRLPPRTRSSRSAVRGVFRSVSSSSLRPEVLCYRERAHLVRRAQAPGQRRLETMRSGRSGDAAAARPCDAVARDRRRRLRNAPRVTSFSRANLRPARPSCRQCPGRAVDHAEHARFIARVWVREVGDEVFDLAPLIDRTPPIAKVMRWRTSASSTAETGVRRYIRRSRRMRDLRSPASCFPVDDRLLSSRRRVLGVRSPPSILPSFARAAGFLPMTESAASRIARVER